MTHCQSCGMPMETEDLYGHNSDGTLNQDYCKYCYEDGEFTMDCSLEEMIENCIPFMVQEGMTPEEARKIMVETLPQLKRWC